MNDSIRFGILGAGLIGNKRAAAIQAVGAKVTGVCDLDKNRAQVLARQHDCPVFDSASGLFASPNIDAVIVATTNDAASSCIVQALKAGKHVLVEKPAGRNPQEVRSWVQASANNRVICRAGFNHRFHPGFIKAKQLLDENAIGELMYFRARYGHGGRIGYDREWRADPDLGGGGELLDQGVHLIDLCRWLGGEFDLKFGHSDTLFWDMPVEDNGFLLLQSPDHKRFAWLHASCSEWKNIFDFEIFGRKGKLQVSGLGRSYGVEHLYYYKMKPEMGAPDLTTFAFPGEDHSWQEELKAFLQEIQGAPTNMGKPQDALRAVEIVYDVYARSGAKWV